MLRSTRHCRAFCARRSYSTNRTADVVIAGGGVVGSSVAYFLSARQPDLRVVVLERDPTYAFCATTRSASGIRHQFSVKENIEISQFGTEFIRNLGTHLSTEEEKVDAQFRENGYLFLASPEGKEILKNNVALQQNCGADILLMSPAEITERFPWMVTHGVVLGSLGLSGEGWFDPATLMHSFRKKARSQGVQYLHGTVTGLKTSDRRVTSVVYSDAHGNEQQLDCGHFVNASGSASARRMASWVGAEIPVFARKRCIFAFDCQEDPKIPLCPLVVDPSGMYFRSEGCKFLTGMAPPDDQDYDVDEDDYEVDYELFEEIIWPLLAARVPAFEAIRVTSAWAGHYDHNIFDHNVIVGPHSGVSNFYFANGFSGHGLQQSPAIGRAISELIISGHFETIDLSKFSFDRIQNNQPIQELNIV